MLSSQVNAMVGSINGQFGTLDYQPVHYINRNVAPQELVPLSLSLYLYLSIYLTAYHKSQRKESNTKQSSTKQSNTKQHNTTQHNTTQHNTTQHKTKQHNTTQHNTTQSQDHNTNPSNAKQRCNKTKKAITKEETEQK
jgi:hypothetical protein